MNEQEAKTKLDTLLRKLSRLSAKIAEGEEDAVKKFVSAKNSAYKTTKWLGYEDRGIYLDKIESVPYTSSLEKLSSIQQGRLHAQADLARRASRDTQPKPGTFEYELVVYGCGGGSK